MTITTVKTDQWIEPNPADSFVEYEVQADGEPTGFHVVRYGTGMTVLQYPNGESRYLSSFDLRRALPEARRRVFVILTAWRAEGRRMAAQ